MSKALTVILVVFCCIFMLPFVFGILGAIFGTFFGIMGGVLGAIGGLFGSIFGLFDNLFNFPMWGWHFGSVYISKVFLATAAVLAVIILTKRSQRNAEKNKIK